MMARPFLAALLVLAIISVIVGSLSPQLAPPSGHLIDKMIHASVYFFLTCLCYLVVTRVRVRWIVVFLLFGMGAIIEVLQAIIGGRQASVYDQLANSVGITLAVIVWNLLEARLMLWRQQLEMPSGD